MPPKNKKVRTVSSTDQQNDACGLCNNLVTTGTRAIECAACERCFHQKCSDLTEQNINAIDGIQSILWCCQECLPAAKRYLRPKAIESIDKKLDVLLESSQQHQDSLIDTETKVDNVTHATTVATESIIKLIKDLSALLPSINKVAHGVVPKISSVKSAVEKMASTYATAASTGTSKAITQNATIERDVTAVLLIENADPSFVNSTNIKHSFSKAFPKKKLMYAFRTTRGHIHLEFASHEESKEIEEAWKSTFMGTETICRRPRKLQHSQKFAAIIYCQGFGTPNIFDKLRTLNILIVDVKKKLLSKRKQKTPAITNEIRKLHPWPVLQRNFITGILRKSANLYCLVLQKRSKTRKRKSKKKKKAC